MYTIYCEKRYSCQYRPDYIIGYTGLLEGSDI